MIALRQQYVAHFAGIPQVVRCESFDGRFELAELLKFGAHGTPMVLVFSLGFDSLEVEGRQVFADVRWMAVVVSKRSDGLRVTPKREIFSDVASVIAMRIVYELLRNNDAFTAARKAATDVDSRNLFGRGLAEAGHTIWSVRWTQRTEIRPEVGVEEPRPLERIRTDFDANPGSLSPELQTEAGVQITTEGGQPLVTEQTPTPDIDAESLTDFT